MARTSGMVHASLAKRLVCGPGLLVAIRVWSSLLSYANELGNIKMDVALQDKVAMIGG